jgi:hypothetical protein
MFRLCRRKPTPADVDLSTPSGRRLFQVLFPLPDTRSSPQLSRRDRESLEGLFKFFDKGGEG